MKRIRRLRTRGRGSVPTSRETKENGKERNSNQAILMFLSLLLLGTGGLALLVAKHTSLIVRRFSSPVIRSATALQGAEHGQAVILRGRIDPQASVSGWGLTIYDREHLDAPPPIWGRFGGRQSPARTWGRRGGSHPPFTLVTDGGRVPIINGHYVIEHPTSERVWGQDRHVGFLPEDEVLVIGESKEGGVAAGIVFGGTRKEFRKTLEEQQALIPAERVLGCVLTGLGAVLLASWVTLRIEGRLRGHGVPPPTRPAS